MGGIVTKYDVGLCADSQDAEDVTSKLAAMIADEDMRKRMGQNGLKAIREEFNWTESEKRLLKLYGEVLSDGK